MLVPLDDVLGLLDGILVLLDATAVPRSDIIGQWSNATGQSSDIIGQWSGTTGQPSDITGHQSDITGQRSGSAGQPAESNLQLILTVLGYV